MHKTMPSHRDRRELVSAASARGLRFVLLTPADMAVRYASAGPVQRFVGANASRNEVLLHIDADSRPQDAMLCALAQAAKDAVARAEPLFLYGPTCVARTCAAGYAVWPRASAMASAPTIDSRSTSQAESPSTTSPSAHASAPLVGIGYLHHRLVRQKTVEAKPRDEQVPATNSSMLLTKFLMTSRTFNAAYLSRLDADYLPLLLPTRGNGEDITYSVHAHRIGARMVAFHAPHNALSP